MLPARWWWSFVAGMIVLTAIVSVVIRNFGRGQVVVIAPEGSELVAVVDGADETHVATRTHVTLAIPPGVHRVLLKTNRGSIEHEVQIVDGFTWVLITSKNQCLDLLDITNQYSTAQQGQAPQPRRVAHLSGGEQLPLSGNVYFVDKDPPTEKAARAAVQLFVETDCVL